MDKNEKLREIFPERLKRAMGEKKLNNKQLARRVGIHPNMIGFYALGKYFPQLDTLAAICDALDVSADWLLGRVKNER